MKKYINRVLLGSVMTMGLATSCSDSYLDTAPTLSVGPGAVFATTENASVAINGIAQIMCSQQYPYSQGCAGENRIKSIYGEYPGQDFVYNGMASGWSPIMNMDYFTRSSTSYASYPWYYYYTIISNANSIIAHIDNAAGTEADRQFIKAQALTFRAYAYSQLVQLYSHRWMDTDGGNDDGVVIRLDESTDSKPLSTLKEVYEQIYADCELAGELYASSGKDRATGKVWLPNKNVMYAVYARAALNRQDYATALENAKLARQNYRLMTNDEYASGFCNPTSEWIFGSYGDESENQWYWSFGTQFSCNGYYASSSSYGAGSMSKQLSDQIPSSDFRKSLYITEDKFPEFDFSSDTVISQTMGYVIDDSLQVKVNEYINELTPSGLQDPYKSGYYYLGAHLKFWVFGTPGVSYLCHIRSSEMVLIEAEANYFLGNESDAIESLLELNVKTDRDKGYACDKTGDELLEEIVKYRRLELWGEGFSWFDYKRWGKSVERLHITKGGNWHAATSLVVAPNTNNEWTWDLPMAETDYNDQINP